MRRGRPATLFQAFDISRTPLRLNAGLMRA
jgi:ribosomal protein S14